jgi:ABC-type branched-subunit amino acid transport system substrate-binding protein
VRLGLLAAVALVLAAAAGGSLQADPGVTPTTIVLGGTVPLSGEAAAFGAVGPGAKAYFDYVNAKGGVNGRKIDYRYYDDAYNPSQTVQLTRKLVEQDKIFAVFNSVATT